MILLLQVPEKKEADHETDNRQQGLRSPVCLVVNLLDHLQMILLVQR